jgi:hypothetical protein
LALDWIGLDFEKIKIEKKRKMLENEFELQPNEPKVSAVSAVSEEASVACTEEKEHSWKLLPFQKPLWCSLCDRFIWGFGKKGYACTGKPVSNSIFRFFEFWNMFDIVLTMHCCCC